MEMTALGQLMTGAGGKPSPQRDCRECRINWSVTSSGERLCTPLLSKEMPLQCLVREVDYVKRKTRTLLALFWPLLSKALLQKACSVGPQCFSIAQEGARCADARVPCPRTANHDPNWHSTGPPAESNAY